jgi:hypothetical protein
MSGRPRYTVAQLTEALGQSKGLVTIAARMLRCDPDTVRNYAKRYPAVAEKIREEREAFLDVAELALLKAVQGGEAWAVCFALKCLGKERGYVERVEQQHSGTVTQEHTGVVEVRAVDYRQSIRALAPPGEDDAA